MHQSNAGTSFSSSCFENKRCVFIWTDSFTNIQKAHIISFDHIQSCIRPTNSRFNTSGIEGHVTERLCSYNVMSFFEFVYVVLYTEMYLTLYFCIGWMEWYQRVLRYQTIAFLSLALWSTMTLECSAAKWSTTSASAVKMYPSGYKVRLNFLTNKLIYCC